MTISEINAKCKVYLIWCLYIQGRKGGDDPVMTAIVDKKTELILWLKVMLGYLFGYTLYIMFINVIMFIFFATPKKTLEIDLISRPWATKPPTPRRKSSASTWSNLALKHIGAFRRFTFSGTFIFVSKDFTVLSVHFLIAQRVMFFERDFTVSHFHTLPKTKGIHM